MQNLAVIVAEGALDMHQVKIIAAAISAMAARGQGQIILDWAAVEGINPLAIGLLLDRRHAALNSGGALKFCRMTAAVRKIFLRFKVEEFFECYETLEDAIESFNREWEPREIDAVI